MSTAIEEKQDKIHVEHREEGAAPDLAYEAGSGGKDQERYLADATEASTQQKEQGFKNTIDMWKPAIVWSVIFSSAIIMEGYDTLLLGQFYAQKAFTERFGEFDAGSNTFQIPAKWQTALGCVVNVGSILGLQLAGWGSERYGYRVTMLVALFGLTGFLFIQFFVTSLPMLLVGYLLLGFPWGCFQTLPVSYAAEVMPVRLRQYLTTYVNLCWVIGQIICSGVNRAFVDNDTEWAYKIPFAIQWIWPIPIFIGIVFAPESPWWLVRKGRFADAKRAIMKLTSRKSGFTQEDARKQCAMMIHNNELEIAQKTGVSFVDCFKGTNLRRTEIACVVRLTQVICGAPLTGQATYLLTVSGLSSSAASTLNLVMFIIGGVGTVGSWFIMQPFGRRTLYLWGQTSLATLMLIVGILGCFPKSSSFGISSGVLLIAFTGLYDLTVGPVCYSLVAEIGSTRLRAKTVILARNLYNLAGLVVSFSNPYMLNPAEWNLSTKSGFVWFGTGCIGIVWTCFRLFEPKGRTYGALDILFEQRIPARKFASTQVDEFAAEGRSIADRGVASGAAVH